jgi:hypothetical protein
MTESISAIRINYRLGRRAEETKERKHKEDATRERTTSRKTITYEKQKREEYLKSKVDIVGDKSVTSGRERKQRKRDE